MHIFSSLPSKSNSYPLNRNILNFSEFTVIRFRWQMTFMSWFDSMFFSWICHDINVMVWFSVFFSWICSCIEHIQEQNHEADNKSNPSPLNRNIIKLASSGLCVFSYLKSENTQSLQKLTFCFTVDFKDIRIFYSLHSFK